MPGGDLGLALNVDPEIGDAADAQLPLAGAELTQADYENLAAFRHALRRFVNFSTEAARVAGLTTQQHQALLAIKGHRGGTPTGGTPTGGTTMGGTSTAAAPTGGALTIGALADTLLVAPHTAAELVMRLEAAGLVARVPDAADKRRVGLRLTDQADEALRKLSLMHLREVRVLAPRLMGIFRDLDAHLG